jgi:hypothetical protein
MWQNPLLNYYSAKLTCRFAGIFDDWYEPEQPTAAELSDLKIKIRGRCAEN